MCGITGIYNFDKQHFVDEHALSEMTMKLRHRGPDDTAEYIDGNIGFGFRRLSIVDLSTGNQPFFNADRSVAMICNGEIFNYKELRKELIGKGYRFRSECDVEVIVHLYSEYGVHLLNKLNGQFALAIFDRNMQQLFLARDHFGICPLFYSVSEGFAVFASEAKALMKHPALKAAVDLVGLDHIFSFPAIIAPTTLFKGVNSLQPGQYALVKDGRMVLKEYWDLNYPLKSHVHEAKSDEYYIEQLEELILRSVSNRLNSDVPVGFYLSGGLDSSLIGAFIKRAGLGKGYDSFSICFTGQENSDIDERRFQRLMSRHLETKHNEVEFSWAGIDTKLREVIYHSEAPLKETYNVCSMALSNKVREEKVKVVLSGEGADELFGGYAGYKFDSQRAGVRRGRGLDDYYEDEVRSVLWGDPEFIYEKNEYEFRETKRALYSNRLNQLYEEFDCLKRPIVNHDRIKGRDIFHQRSYIDFKLRLSGHLIADHGDRMTFANNIEGRYPFLDIDLVEFVKTIPPKVKLKGMTEKFILKELAGKYLPKEIINREKFGFVAPGSPQLLKNNVEWINDMLSYSTIKRQGYFNADTIERLKKKYLEDGFILTPPYDQDLLIIILTFNIFLEVFGMPGV